MTNWTKGGLDSSLGRCGPRLQSQHIAFTHDSQFLVDRLTDAVRFGLAQSLANLLSQPDVDRVVGVGGIAVRIAGDGVDVFIE
jgi:hypothetical protein